MKNSIWKGKQDIFNIEFEIFHICNKSNTIYLYLIIQLRETVRRFIYNGMFLQSSDLLTCNIKTDSDSMETYNILFDYSTKRGYAVYDNGYIKQVADLKMENLAISNFEFN